MKKTFILLVVFFATTFTLFAQPQLTLWRILDEAPHQTGSEHTTPPEFAPCGSIYYFILEGNATSTTSLWSIKNEGDEDLELDLPLQFAGGSDPRFEIIAQPSQAVLAPGEETHFTLQYTLGTSEENAIMVFGSNDPNATDCSLIMNGGDEIPDPVFCFCEDNIVKEEVLMEWQETGVILIRPGIDVRELLKFGPCAPQYQVGASCGIPTAPLPGFPKGGIILFAGLILAVGLFLGRERLFI